MHCRIIDDLSRLIDGLPPLNGDKYRPVIFDMLAAYRAGHQIGIELVRNVDLASETLDGAEDLLQEKVGLTGGVRMLDADGMPAARRPRNV